MSSSPIERVAVLGATGLVGERVVDLLLDQGIEVVALSRRRQPARKGVSWITADLDTDPLPTLEHSSHVVSTLAMWRTARVVDRLVAQGATRLVAFSSSSVSTKARAGAESERVLSQSLAHAESEVLSRSAEIGVTIFRPTMIYGGPGDSNVERIAQSLVRMPLFPTVGNGKGLRQPVHAADLARAAVSVLDQEQCVGKTYVLAGGEVLNVREMIHRVGTANGVRPLTINVPAKVLAFVLTAVSKLPKVRAIPPGAIERMTQDLTFDNGPAREDFGYDPRNFDPPDYRSGRASCQT